MSRGEAVCLPAFCSPLVGAKAKAEGRQLPPGNENAHNGWRGYVRGPGFLSDKQQGIVCAAQSAWRAQLVFLWRCPDDFIRL